MEYEIVNLEEKKAVGISAVTNNKSPEMPKIIGGLWDEFYKKVYCEINDKTNNKSIGMYHKYQPNERSRFIFQTFFQNSCTAVTTLPFTINLAYFPLGIVITS